MALSNAEKSAGCAVVPTTYCGASIACSTRYGVRHGVRQCHSGRGFLSRPDGASTADKHPLSTPAGATNAQIPWKLGHPIWYAQPWRGAGWWRSVAEPVAQPPSAVEVLSHFPAFSTPEGGRATVSRAAVCQTIELPLGRTGRARIAIRGVRQARGRSGQTRYLLTNARRAAQIRHRLSAAPQHRCA